MFDSFTDSLTVRDFDEKTHQKETLKSPEKLVIFASTYSKFHNENRANCTFQRVPAVKFLQRKKHVLENMV